MKQIDLSSNQRIVFFTGACCIEINPEPSGAIGHDLVIGEPASRALPELFARNEKALPPITGNRIGGSALQNRFGRIRTSAA